MHAQTHTHTRSHVHTSEASGFMAWTPLEAINSLMALLIFVSMPTLITGTCDTSQKLSEVLLVAILL